MGFLEKFIGGAFALIALYLVIVHADGANNVLTGFGSASSNVFKTLQGNG